MRFVTSSCDCRFVVSKEDSDRALDILRENGEEAYVIGEIVSGEQKIELV